MAATISMGTSQKVLISVIYVIFSVISAAVAGQSCAPCEVKQELQHFKEKNGASFEEFVLEHEVARKDAIEALRGLNDSFFEGPTEPGCRSINCNHKVMKYCLGPLFLNDHCLCEQSHEEEGLPFVPHICYVGDRPHTASAGSCFHYMELKQCCCARALAKRWKSISPSSRPEALPFLVIAALISVIKIFHTQKIIFFDKG